MARSAHAARVVLLRLAAVDKLRERQRQGERTPAVLLRQEQRMSQPSAACHPHQRILQGLITDYFRKAHIRTKLTFFFHLGYPPAPNPDKSMPRRPVFGLLGTDPGKIVPRPPLFGRRGTDQPVFVPGTGHLISYESGI